MLSGCSHPFAARMRVALLAISLAFVAFSASQPEPAAAATVPFFAENASNEAMLSEMAIHPAAVTTGTVTYIAYQGPGYDPYVAAYDSATGTWAGPFRAGSNPLSLDAHGAPSLYFDATGRLHVLYGGHNRKLLHSRAVLPGSIELWQELPYAALDGTYPQVMDTNDGRVRLFYRLSNHDWVMCISDESRSIFGEETTILDANDTDTWWYADFRSDGAGGVNAAFVWVDNIERLSGETWGRENAYYLHGSPDGTWASIEGTQVVLPVDRAAADETARIYDSLGQTVNEISVKSDDEGRPCVLFLTGQGFGADAYTWMFGRFESGAWRFTPIATTDHPFDSGAIEPGSDGAVEALLVTGENGAAGGIGQDMRGRGGTISRYTSADRGLTWDPAGRVSPDEKGSDFADPQYVLDGTGDARAAFIEWDNDASLFFNRMFLWGDGGIVDREITSSVERIAGAARAQTAVEVSKAAFPEGARTVVIATQWDFPDALAGVPLADRLEAPLLLSQSTTLSPGVAEEISRLGATNAVLLGGSNALSSGIEADLLSRTRVTAVERLEGGTRYDTALAIARRMLDPDHPVDTAVVVSGENWPDAATAAPLAASLGAPVLLTRGDSLPSQTATALVEWETSSTIVVGGVAVIDPEVEALLPQPRRIAGADRYETSALVAEEGLSTTLLPHRVLLATGFKFPDALAGATLAARLRAPVLLVQPHGLPDPVEDYIGTNAGTLTRAVVLGNAAAVSTPVEERVRWLLGVPVPPAPGVFELPSGAAPGFKPR